MSTTSEMFWVTEISRMRRYLAQRKQQHETLEMDIYQRIENQMQYHQLDSKQESITSSSTSSDSEVENDALEFLKDITTNDIQTFLATETNTTHELHGSISQTNALQISNETETDVHDLILGVPITNIDPTAHTNTITSFPLDTSSDAMPNSLVHLETTNDIEKELSRDAHDNVLVLNENPVPNVGDTQAYNDKIKINGNRTHRINMAINKVISNQRNGMTQSKFHENVSSKTKEKHERERSIVKHSIQLNGKKSSYENKERKEHETSNGKKNSDYGENIAKSTSSLNSMKHKMGKNTRVSINPRLLPLSNSTTDFESNAVGDSDIETTEDENDLSYNVEIEATNLSDKINENDIEMNNNNYYEQEEDGYYADLFPEESDQEESAVDQSENESENAKPETQKPFSNDVIDFFPSIKPIKKIRNTVKSAETRKSGQSEEPVKQVSPEKPAKVSTINPVSPKIGSNGLRRVKSVIPPKSIVASAPSRSSLPLINQTTTMKGKYAHTRNAIQILEESAVQSNSLTNKIAPNETVNGNPKSRYLSYRSEYQNDLLSSNVKRPNAFKRIVESRAVSGTRNYTSNINLDHLPIPKKKRKTIMLEPDLTNGTSEKILGRKIGHQVNGKNQPYIHSNSSTSYGQVNGKKSVSLNIKEKFTSSRHKSQSNGKTTASHYGPSLSNQIESNGTHTNSRDKMYSNVSQRQSNLAYSNMDLPLKSYNKTSKFSSLSRKDSYRDESKYSSKRRKSAASDDYKIHDKYYRRRHIRSPSRSRSRSSSPARSRSRKRSRSRSRSPLRYRSRRRSPSRSRSRSRSNSRSRSRSKSHSKSNSPEKIESARAELDKSINGYHLPDSKPGILETPSMDISPQNNEPLGNDSDVFISDSDEEDIHYNRGPTPTNKLKSISLDLSKIHIDEDEVQKQIYVSGISSNITEEFLMEVFQQFDIAKDRYTNFPRIDLYFSPWSHRPRGDCCIEFTSAENAEIAVQEVHNKIVNGSCKLSVAPMTTHIAKILKAQFYDGRELWRCANESCDHIQSEKTDSNGTSLWFESCKKCNRKRVIPPSFIRITNDSWLCSICYGVNVGRVCNGCKREIPLDKNALGYK